MYIYIYIHIMYIFSLDIPMGGLYGLQNATTTGTMITCPNASRGQVPSILWVTGVTTVNHCSKNLVIF